MNVNKKLTFFGGVILVAGLAAYMLWPQSEPVGQMMTPSETSDTTPGDPIVSVSLPATLSDNAEIGKNAFEATCAKCHGQNAAGQDGVAPPLVHKIYEPSHHGDEAFWFATQRGVQSHHWRFGNMPPIEGLTRADVKAIVAYVRELQRENGIN